MANSKGRGGLAHKSYYNNYDPVAARKRRLERHLKDHPNDEQARAVAKNPSNRRKKPENENGWFKRDTDVGGFVDSKNGSTETKSPKLAAWVRSIVKKAERKANHEQNYKTKAERKKGGKARA